MEYIPTIPSDTKPMTNLQKFYERAKFYADYNNGKGFDASPKNKAPQHLACAETVNAIHEDVFGEPICKINELSTYYLRRDLKERTDFKQVTREQAGPGTIIISATGYGGKNGIKHGHVGILYDYNNIMGNNSPTGLFNVNWTVDKWMKYYGEKGGYEVLFFNKL